MGVWMNWGLVVAAISFIIGDLVLDVYPNANLVMLGMSMLAGGILGLGMDSTTVGLATALVLVVASLLLQRRPGHLQPKRVSGH
jgi:hypothetical protein